MAVIKRVLCQERLRQVPPQFSWIDHRLVRDRHICRCSHPALALYLFLVTVADGQGLSYYGQASLCRMLKLDPVGLAAARQELITARLIAYQSPLYQVLALDAGSPPAASGRPPASGVPRQPEPSRPKDAVPENLGQILRNIMEKSS
jgi:hypothetical protein